MIFQDKQANPNISEDVPNSITLMFSKNDCCSIRTFKNQRFQGKYRHLIILPGLFISRIGFSLDIFGKCVN